MLQQSAQTFIMVHPDHFGFNAETAESNPYQHAEVKGLADAKAIRGAALLEFERMVQTLQAKGINVLVLPSVKDVRTPDAVFLNNWFSHHEDGTLVLYPMLAENRRKERQREALEKIMKDNAIPVAKTIDLTSDEEQDLFLESTGSMVLDRINKVAFAMASSRTNEHEFKKWCSMMGYEGVYIVTPKSHAKEVYHTNLLMSIGTEFAVVCLEVIEDDAIKQQVKSLLEDYGKEVIEISLEQVYAFCGNILEVQSKDKKKLIVMSENAHEAFTDKQIALLKKHGELVVIPIPTIELVGGGGVRCMMAEVFS